jgi:CRISPR/Cas system-associated endonuclease/helicase Cas3
MVDIVIQKKNEVYIKVKTEPHIHQELSEYFTFDVPGAKFMPQYRSKYWDGKIRLYSNHTGEIYVGLLDKLISWAKKFDYSVEFEDNQFYGTPFEENEMISYEGVSEFMKKISKHNPRDYQINAVYDALRYNRKLLISPTASGKSLMIYSVVRYFEATGKKILLVVPTTSLVEQMYKDFEDYGWNAEEHCHKIYGGKEKTPLWVYVTADNGIQYKFEGNESINLINNKKKLAKDLKESDEIDDRWLLSIKK